MPPTALAIYNDRSLYDQLWAKHPNETQLRWATFLSIDLKVSRRFLDRERTRRQMQRQRKSIARIKSRLDSFDTVADAVFDTSELLEMIFLHLPVNDMLVLQRVNRTFRSVAQQSVKTRRALCLTPSPLSTAVEFFEYDCEDLRNPAVIRLSKTRLDPWKLKIFKAMESDDEEDEAGVWEMHLGYEMLEHYCSRYKPLHMCYTHDAQSSWKGMLLSEPSCDRVCIHLFAQGGKKLIRTEVIESNRVTMGEVDDWLRRTYSETVASENWREHFDPTQSKMKGIALHVS